MASVTFYNNYHRASLAGEIALGSDTIRVALVSDNTAYAPDVDNEQFVSDVLDGGTTAEELDATNYSRQTLSNTSVTQDNTDDEGVFDADDTVFADLGGASNDTIAGALIYQQVGGDDTTPGNDVLIGYWVSDDFPLPTNGGDITLGWATEGLINQSG